MKILLLGATGRTGKEVLNQALHAGISVNVVVRDQRKLKLDHSALTVFESEALDQQVLRNAMQDCDAVLSTLNISRYSDFPWSSLRTPETFLSDTIQKILAIAADLPLKRVIVISAWGVHETRQDIPFWFRWLMDRSNIGAGYRDHERQEILLKASSLDWTAIRPVGLTNFKKEKLIHTTVNHNNPKPGLLISRSNVARFMLQVYHTHSFVRQTVTISEA